ncbi:MAG TPA: hypothetical protein VEC17_01680 [Candidatus Binatia bacterium]|nr:hypothetical protein [Candidatus Binatia bacterium]
MGQTIDELELQQHLDKLIREALVADQGALQRDLDLLSDEMYQAVAKCLPAPVSDYKQLEAFKIQEVHPSTVDLAQRIQSRIYHLEYWRVIKEIQENMEKHGKFWKPLVFIRREPRPNSTPTAIQSDLSKYQPDEKDREFLRSFLFGGW